MGGRQCILVPIVQAWLDDKKGNEELLPIIEQADKECGGRSRKAKKYY